MQRVLLIAGVLVLLLLTVALWLSLEPSPKAPNERTANTTKKKHQPLEPSDDQVKIHSPSNETRPQLTQAAPAHAANPEKDTGFRPIVETQSNATLPPATAMNSTEGLTPPSEGAQPVPSGPDTDRGSHEPLMHASDGRSTDSQVVPPRPDSDVPAQSPPRKSEAKTQTIDPPGNSTARTGALAPPTTVAKSQPGTGQGPPAARVAPDTAQRQARRQRPPAPPGRYETTMTATARASANDRGQVIDRIRRGTILNVTGSEGDWLVVYSKRKNITVYVNRDEAMLHTRPTPVSTDVPEDRWPEVEQAIRQAFLRNNVVGIQATFIGNTAYLKGKVRTDSERERAEIFARSVLEVKHVFNGIRVE